MNRGRNARLDRLVRRITAADDAKIDRRDMLRAEVKIGAFVRWGLPQLGIDPASAVSLRVADAAATELAALGEPVPVIPGENCSPTAWLRVLDDQLARLVLRYHTRGLAEPDPKDTSLAQLFAWCLARLAGDGVEPALGSRTSVG